MTTGPQQLNAWQLLLLVHREISRRLAREFDTELGLSLRVYEVLFYLSNAGDQGLQVGQLAESLALEPSSATRFIDRMERERLVRRVRGKGDRRLVHVVLTPQGRKRYTEASSLYVDIVGDWFAAHITHSEARVLNEALDRVLAGVR